MCACTVCMTEGVCVCVCTRDRMCVSLTVGTVCMTERVYKCVCTRRNVCEFECVCVCVLFV